MFWNFCMLVKYLSPFSNSFEEETTNLFAKIKDKNKEENH